MPHETSKALAAYNEYAALGQGRSLEKLHAMYQMRSKAIPDEKRYVPPLSTLKSWSSKFEWVKRASAYDLEQIATEAEEKRRKRDEAIESMNSRHAQIGVTQQLKAIAQIEELIKAKEFGSMAVVQLLKLATDLERSARGESTTQKIELSGKNGGPIKTHGTVSVYLPQKEDMAKERE